MVLMRVYPRSPTKVLEREGVERVVAERWRAECKRERGER